MIKEIAEEFDKQNRINVLRLLEKIKDLEYEVTGIYKDILLHTNEKEKLKIYLYFSRYNRNINKIDIASFSGWGNTDIVKIETGLNTKVVTAISEELHTKYFGGKK